MPIEPLSLSQVVTLSEKLGLPVRVDPTGQFTGGRPAAYAGPEIGIVLTPKVARILDPRMFTSSRFPRRTAKALFTLAHEYGHYQDKIPYDPEQPHDTRNVNAYEQRANEYALANFRRYARMFGASPARTRQLWRRLPYR